MIKKMTGLLAGLVILFGVCGCVRPIVVATPDLPPTSPTPASESSSTGVDDAFGYAPVLNQYRDAASNLFCSQSAYDALPDDWATDARYNWLSSEMMLAKQPGDGCDAGVQYVFNDINDDGNPELIVGSPNDDGTVHKYGLYSAISGTIYRLLDDYSLGYRNNFSLFVDGIIATFGSGAWNLHGYDFYEMSSDSKSLVLLDEITVYDDVYYQGPGAPDGSSYGTQISLDQANAISKKHTGKPLADVADQVSADRNDIQLDWQDVSAGSYPSGDAVIKFGDNGTPLIYDLATARQYLAGTSDAFQNFAAAEGAIERADCSTCGISVQAYMDGYAIGFGGSADGDGAALLWTNRLPDGSVGGQWRQAMGTQFDWDCQQLTQLKVPSALGITECYDYTKDQELPYSQP